MSIEAYKKLRTAEVDASPLRSFVVFIEGAGKWGFLVWVVVVVAGLATLGFSIAQVSQVPPTTWALLLALGVFLAPAVAFHFLRVQRDLYKAMWEAKERA